ncbi:uncharacterized protein LOC131255738 isoform X1 [Magnolia sinica]|uniref:uncharacterized protein LOC131255738 isoform X1 n=1 Tax=Magnolia sinica TaxID=86752 RepID=UPI002657D711|nr:uncharacterized protein LOC131255738 isoform X1 [Magnolia sinica]
MTNLSIIASEVPVYSVVLEYLLAVAVHLLLFRADLCRILQSIGTLLLVFLLGSGLKVRICKSGEAYECRTILPCDARQLHEAPEPMETEFMSQIIGYGLQRRSAQQCHLCSTS